jgi:hypothetical protein
MNNLNLDLFVPDYHIPSQKPRTRNQKMMARAGYVFIYSDGFAGRRLGVRPEKMLDWRSIEKRYSELEFQQKEAWDLFWNTTQELRKKYIDNCDDDTELWVGIDECNNHLLSITKQGYQHRLAESELKFMMKDSTKYKYVFLKYVEGGKDLAKKEARYRRLLRAANIYKNAFQRTVGDRILKFAMSQNDYPGWHSSFTTVIQNEDRFHVASMENWTVRWNPGLVYVTQNR